MVSSGYRGNYIAFTPGPQHINNPSLIAYCNDNTARLWKGDIVKGVTAAWIQHTRKVQDVAAGCGPDGKLFIATADDYGNIRVWEEPERDPQAIYQYPPGADSRGFAFSRDNRFAIVPTDDTYVQVVDTGSGRKVGREIKVGGGKTGGWEPIISSDGLYLYGRDFNHELWDVKRGEKITPPSLKGVPTIPGLRHLAFEGDDRRFSIWRTGSAALKPFLLPRDAARVLLSPDEEHFVTSNDSGQLLLWKIFEEPAPDGSLRAESATMSGDTTPARIFAESYSRTGRYLVTASQRTNPTAVPPDTGFSNKLWLRKGDGQPVSTVEIGGQYFEIGFSYDESHLAVIGKDSSVIVLRTIDGKEVRQWKLDQPARASLHFNITLDSKGDYLALSIDGEISLWDVRSGQRLTKVEYPYDEFVTAIAFSPSDKYLLVATNKQVERVLWKVSDLVNEAQARLPK